MKFMKKKVLGLVVSIAMVLSLFVLPVSVNAANEKVAKICDTEYATLEDAVKYVKNGETITLLDNVPNATGIAIQSGKNFTIDFAGYTYTLVGPGAGSFGTETNGFQLLQGSNITFKNGTIRIAKDARNIKRIIQNYSNLTLEDMQIYSENQKDNEDYTLSINNGNVIFKGNTSIITTSSDIIAFDICKFSSYPSAHVTFDESYTGKITGKIVYDSPDANTHSLTIKGDGHFAGIDKLEKAAANPNINVYGGTYNDTDALKYLQSGGQITVDLNSDVKDDLVVPKNTTVTLNLNGYTISNISNHTINNKGTLDINGEGIIDNVTHQKAAINNELGATATLNGGTYTRSKENGSNSADNGVNPYYNIVNHGTMTINENVVVKQDGQFSSLLENGWYSGSQNTSGTPSVLTINGGTFSGGLNTIKNDDYGQLTINNGTFENVSQAALLNWNIATVNGGTFTSDNSNVILNGRLDDTMDQGILTITGGKFVAAQDKDVIAKMGDGNADSLNRIEITGGTYSSDVSQYVDSHYQVHYVDGEYIIAPMTTKITLSSAQENIHVGDSLTLKATVEPTDSLDAVTWSSSDNTVATVDANGKVTAIGAGKATITAKAGNQTATCEVTVYEVESDVEAPVIDTSKPVDEVTVGINDEESQENISDTLTSIVDDIANGKEVTSVNQETTENIKQAIDDGKVVSTEVQVKPVETSQVDVQDKKVIEDYIDEKTNIAQYIDISVVIKADNEVIGEVNELNKEVTFTVAIPEDLMKEGRTFYVIRVHDGKAEKLDTVENEDGTLTFKTDKFSTYALAYEDAQESITTPITPVQPAQPGQSQDDVKGETVVTPDNNQQVTNTQNTQETTKEPKTGDTSNIALYGAMALISLGLVGAIVLKKKVSKK